MAPFDGTPAWWQFTAEEWGVFRHAVGWALEVHGEAAPPEFRAAIAIRRPDGNTVDLDLDRLAGNIRQLPPARWPAAVARYFADQREQAGAARSEPVAPDIEHVRRLLRPRLLHRDALPPGGTRLLWNIGPDLVGLLEVAGSETNHWVESTDLTAWGVPARELWNIALENLRQEDHQVSREGLVSLVTGSGPYVASHALRLGELPTDPAPHGFLVAVPHPALVLFLPLVGADWVVVMRELPGIVERMCGGEHGALSPHIYWSEGAVFERVGITEVNNKVTITGSERFSALANRILREAAGSGQP